MTDPAARYIHRRAAWDLVVDGESISPTVNPRLVSLSLTERRGADADELEIVLDDHDGKLAIPPAGAIITLKLGWQDMTAGATPQLIEKGTFQVQDRSHGGLPDRLTISARSADLTRAFRNRRTQTWRETTLGDVLGEIAGRNGLQPHVAAAKASIAIAHLNQARESDSAFLARLGRIHDAVATVKAGRLLFSAVGAGETAGGGQIPPASVTRRDGDRHSWKSAERENYSGVTAEWQDRSTGERRSVTSGSTDNAQRLGRTYASEEAARRATESQQARQQRKGAEFSLDFARARPDLYPERTLTVSGWKPEIDGTSWLISQVRHQIDGSGGARTSIECETAAPPARAS